MGIDTIMVSVMVKLGRTSWLAVQWPSTVNVAFSK
jgi:hypothetical protein